MKDFKTPSWLLTCAAGVLTAHSAFAYGTVTRLLTNAALDPSFNGSGKETFGPASGTHNLVTRWGTKLFVFGTDGGSINALARLNTDGSPDTAFGYGGVTAVTFPTGNLFYATDMGIQSGARIVILGGAANPQNSFLTRFAENGAVDTSFGANGFATPYTPTPALGAGRLVIGADDRIYTVSAPDHAHDLPGRLARLSANGTIDTSRTVKFCGQNVYPAAISLDNNGNVYVAGEFESTRSLVVVKFHNDLSLDTAFATGLVPGCNVAGGLYVVPDSVNIAAFGFGMFVDPDSRVVLVWAAGANGVKVRRLDTFGLPDGWNGTYVFGETVTNTHVIPRISATSGAGYSYMFAGYGTFSSQQRLFSLKLSQFSVTGDPGYNGAGYRTVPYNPNPNTWATDFHLDNANRMVIVGATVP